MPSGSALTKTGYDFSGWNTSTAGSGTNYTAGSSYTFTSSTTLYAKWSRNFTCASAGSTTTYAGKSWYTVSNDGEYCNLALNSVSSASDTYANATTKLTSEYFTSGGANYNSVLAEEKNAGLTSILGTYTQTSGLSSGIIWKSASTATTIGKTFKIYSLTSKSFYYDGKHLTTSKKSVPPSISLNSNAPSSTNKSNCDCDSVSNTDCVINNASYSSSTTSQHYSNTYTVFYTMGKSYNQSSSSFTIARDNHLPDRVGKYSTTAKVLKIVPCGGDYDGRTLYKITAKDSKKATHYNASNKNTSTIDITKDSTHTWNVSGTANETKDGTTITYNPVGTSDYCSKRTVYTLGTAKNPINYRLYIKIKI